MRDRRKPAIGIVVQRRFVIGVGARPIDYELFYHRAVRIGHEIEIPHALLIHFTKGGLVGLSELVDAAAVVELDVRDQQFFGG